MLLKPLAHYTTDEIVLSKSDTGELVIKAGNGMNNDYGFYNATLKLAMEPIDGVKDLIAKMSMLGKSSA